MLLPFIAAMGDLLENTLHLIILRDTTSLPSALIWLTSLAAADVIGLLVWRGIGVWRSRRRARR